MTTFSEVAFGDLTFGNLTTVGKIPFGNLTFGEIKYGEVAFGEPTGHQVGSDLSSMNGTSGSQKVLLSNYSYRNTGRAPHHLCLKPKKGLVPRLDQWSIFRHL